MIEKTIKIVICAFLFIFISCEKDTIPTEESNDNIETIDTTDTTGILKENKMVLNPSGYAPLSAMVSLKTDVLVRVDLKISGKNGESSDINKSFPELAKELDIPIHGLYADYENTVELTFFDAEGSNLGINTYKITTDPLISDMPEITIDTANRDQIAPGMTLVSYYGYNQSTNPFRPFMFDSYGDIRWYLNFMNSPILNNLYFDNGPHRLANGNFYFANKESDAIYEVDLFGNILNTWEMDGYEFHHEVYEKPNGNFLVTVDKIGLATIEDHIIEIDRLTNQIIQVWDLNTSLDNTRNTLGNTTEDWIHVNGISYDPSDDTIVVSGRTQGVVKLTNTNEIVWIIGLHKNWGTAGNGIDLKPFLLQPLDADGIAITDQSILDGDTNHPDFEWNWYQHATKVMPNGNIVLFDNGYNRNFSSTADATPSSYSRAVEFKVDKQDGTIQQVWQYGKDRGLGMYSRIVSDVDYLETENNMIISSGNIVSGSSPIGKCIEVDIASNEVLFEANVIPPKAYINKITFHRTERLSLYPN